VLICVVVPVWVPDWIGDFGAACRVMPGHSVWFHGKMVGSGLGSLVGAWGGGGLGSSVVVHFPHYLCALLGIPLGPSGCTPILKYSTPGDGCCPMDGETFYRAEKQTTDIHRLAEGQPSAKSHSLPGHGHPDTVLVVLVHWTKDSGDEPEFLAELRSMPSSAPERPAVSSQKHEIWQLKILHFSPELIH